MTEGTFLVTEADPESALLRDVETGRIYPLSTNPGLEADEIVSGTLEARSDLELAWELTEFEAHDVPVARDEESPTAHAREVAEETKAGEVTRLERAGEGEVHVLALEADTVESAIEDVLEDPATLERAARLGVSRVEVRIGEEFLSVRYLP